MLSVHRRCHLVVTCKLQKICSWTSINSSRNAHGTRPAAALNSLTSPIPMSLCKELETSVFRCKELLSNLCQLRRHLFSPCHSCRFLQRHHFNVLPVTPVAPETPQLSVPSTPPFQCFPGGETAPVTPHVENSKIAQPAPSFSVLVSRPMPTTFAVPSTLPADPFVPTEVPSTLLPDPVVAHSHADPVVAHDHVPTQFDEESAVDTQSDDPFQFDDPPVPAPVILSQSKPLYDLRDDLPQHIRTQLKSRIRKPAQNLEPDAKRSRLDAGKRAVLTRSHDVSSGPECCKPVTIFKSCGNWMCRCSPHSSSCEQGSAVRRTREVAAGTCGRCDGSRMGQVERVRSHKVLVQKTAERHHEAKPRPENRGNQMGLHGEDIQGKPDYKARLVVQGCQEDKGYIRTDAPTGSRDAFFMTLSAASQSGWDYSVFDAQSAYLQSDGIKRLLLLRMPHKYPPPGTKPGQVFVATGSIYGTRDAGRAWYEHSKKVLEAARFVESRLEQGLYYLHGPSGLEALVHTHVDDFLSAFKKACKKYKDALQHLVHDTTVRLHLKQSTR